MKPRIVDQQGIPAKGVACFTYKGHTIVLDILSDEPEIKVTINGTVRTFTTMDQAIDEVILYQKQQFDLDSPV